MNVAVTKPRIRVPSGGETTVKEIARLNEQNMVAYTGADDTSRELSTWDVQNLSGDAAILPERGKLSGRSADIVRNNGYGSRVSRIRKDNIIGHLFKLSYKPNWRVLGVDPDSQAASDFVHDVESYWADFAEDPECRIDAEGKRTFTQIMRGAVDQDLHYGELLCAAEWLRRPGLQTAIKVINPERVSNPNLEPDRRNLRAGVKRTNRGRAQGYWIRQMHQSESRFSGSNPMESFKWRFVRTKKSWGRYQILHVFDPVDDGATRGVSPMAPILERFKMLDKFQGVTLQNAILNAMYAMVIESEFDSITALEALGASGDTANNALTAYMTNVSQYHKGANIRFNGLKIPHLFPNEKLNLLTPDAPTTGEFEDRLLRYMAAGSNLNFETLSSNYSKVNFSGAKLSLGETWRFFLGERELYKRYAGLIFGLVLEEMFSKGIVSPPSGSPAFWDAKSAWCKSDWIGAGKTMVDGLKDVKEIILKLEAGLITYEKACAVLGEDYKDILDQQIRENRERKDAGLPPASWMSTQSLSPDPMNENPEVNTNAQTG